jgi:molybdopterin converting factor small subunit
MRNCVASSIGTVSITFHISGYLTAFASGQSRVEIRSCSTVRDALDALWSLHVGLRDRVLTEQGQVRPHVNIFVGDENIRMLAGFETTITPSTEICILPSVSGG